jgi:peptide/nickel transport system permease protein
MKKINLALLVGGIIIASIVLIMMFPKTVAPYNPYVMENIKPTTSKDGSLAIKGAPFPPSKENILGTDSLGRDVLSIIIYGTRLTLQLGVLVVLGRLVIALPVGLYAGFGNSICKSAISLFSVLFSAIPALLISLLILKKSYFVGLFKYQSIIAFVIVLTLVGWAKLAGVIRERVENILSQPFITGEKAIGKSNFKIATQNVLPHLAPELIVLVFMEMALVLAMIMELGFFTVFVGNLRVNDDFVNGIAKPVNISYEPEWASMLSTSIEYLDTAPWTVLSPAAAFFISMFGFNLFGEGLREKLQSKDSKLVVYFRRAFRLKIFKGKVIKTVSLILSALIIIITAQGIIGYHNNKISAKQASSIMNWEFKDQVLIGSEDAKYTADNLQSSLEKAGFKPIIQDYNIDKLFSVDKCDFSINNSNIKRELIFGKDFTLQGYRDYILKGEVYNSIKIDMFNQKDYSIFNNKFVVFDEEIYSRNAIKEFSDKLRKESKALGVINIIGSDEKLPSVASTESSDKVIIYMTKAAAGYLKESSEITIDMKSCSLLGKGRNVIGILPGSKKELFSEAIMISVGYNYLAYDRVNVEKKLKFAIELAKKLYDSKEKQGRSIIIAFWDGNLMEDYSGVKHYTKNSLYPLEDTVVNIDFTTMNIKSDTLVMNTRQTPVERYFAWAFNHQLEVNIKNSGINIEKSINKESVTDILNNGPNSSQFLYFKGAVPTILIISKQDNTIKKNTVETNFVDILFNTITKNNY